MIKKTTLLTLLATISFGVFAEVGLEDLNEIKKLTDAEQYEQALKKHIWFHEESKRSSGMGGVRLSFALSAWVELSKKYPPAGDALVNLRNNYKEKLFSGAGSFEDFHDFTSINRKIKQKDETYKLFIFLHKEYPRQASRYYYVVQELFIERKEYQFVGEYTGDAIIKYGEIKHLRDRYINRANDSFTEKIISFYLKYIDPDTHKQLDNKYGDGAYVNGVIELIDVLVASERIKEAKEIQKMALSYFEHKKIKNAINSQIVNMPGWLPEKSSEKETVTVIVSCMDSSFLLLDNSKLNELVGGVHTLGRLSPIIT